MEEIGIPIIECAEYMEPSPLARAEWLRFYGMLFGCESRADSLFAVVDSSYCALKGLFTVDKQKSVLLDKVTGSVWYVPGGRSTIGQMIQDAGGNYPWAHGYGQFKAFRSGEIYGCDVERSLFYEESPFRPDWLLGDYIHILHPDIPNLPPLRYYKKIKKL